MGEGRQPSEGRWERERRFEKVGDADWYLTGEEGELSCGGEPRSKRGMFSFLTITGSNDSTELIWGIENEASDPLGALPAYKPVVFDCPCF
jgi:hypothetical protein